MYNVQIKDIMTRDVISIDRALGLDVALETMRANNVRRLPVLSSTKRVVGIVSLADAELGLAKAAEEMALDPHSKPLVRDVMTDFVHTIDQDASVADAAKMMVTFEIGALPVLDDADHMVGIVTESDLFKFIANKLSAEGEGE